jgi:RHS repeat-associated protein
VIPRAPEGRSLLWLALLLVCAGLAPSTALASLPSLTEPRAKAFDPPQLPSALDEIERRESERAACRVFCGEPLKLGLRVGLGSETPFLVTQDAWGNFRFPDELTASKNRFAFTGYEWDPETGLFNAKARYFDPALGRFLSQDSFLGQIDEPPSLHRYFYANANPLRFVDPTGHAAGDFWDPRSYDWKVFGQEFGTRLGETGANIATLGGYGGIKRGFEEGRITGTAFGSAGRAYAEGVFNTITLGGGERSIGAYAEGKGAGGMAVEGLKGAGETVLPINEIKALADPTKSEWEKAEAIATATTKVASVAAAGVAAKSALAQRAATRAGVVTESTAAGAEASVAPAEGALAPPKPLPRVAGGSQAVDAAETAAQAAVHERVLANLAESRAARASSNFQRYAGRETAWRFYDEGRWTSARIADHMRGIDVAYPVDVVTLPEGTGLVQFQRPGVAVGNYFGPPGTSAEALGIYPKGRVPTTYVTSRPVSVLRSTAARIKDFWSIPGETHEVTGGGIQYFVREKTAFVKK